MIRSTRHWTPRLAQTLAFPTLDKRPLNKTALQIRLDLPVQTDVPLLGVISRMDPQKGLDLIPRALRQLKDLNIGKQ